MHFRKYIFVSICMCFICSMVVAQHEIKLNSDEHIFSIGQEVYYFEDPSHKLHLASIIESGFADSFTKSTSQILNFGIANATFWLRFTVKADSQQMNENWLLELAFPAIDEVEFYFQDSVGNWQVKKYGDSLPFEQREFYYRNFIISLPQLSEGSHTFYLKLTTQGVATFPLKLLKENQLYQIIQNDLIYAVFFGAMWVMLIYNLFVFFALKDMSYLLYVAVILVAFSYLFAIRGFAFQHLFPNNPLFANKLTLLSASLWIVVCPLFANSFLQANKEIPLWSKILKLSSLLGALLFLFVYTLPFNLIAKIVSVVGILACLVMITTGILALRKGQRSARFFILAWSVYLFGVITLIFSNLGFVKTSFLTFHIGEIAAITEVLLLSLALSDRFHLLKKEKENAQIEALTYQKLANADLEYMVKERTAEIIQQNEEIAMQRDTLEKQKAELEKSYDNLRLLHDIGQKVISTLDIRVVIERMYKNIKSLTNADAFGVGVYNKSLYRIDFEGFIENGEVLKYHFDTLAEKHKPSVQCFLEKKEIILNEKDLEGYPVEYGELPKGVLYLPLITEEETLGVMSVQSFRGELSNPQNLMLFRNLAAYISIGLANAKVYQTIQDKNQNITDSIRYAQTIQKAILPTERELTRILGDYFVLFRPCQIVSGDFYWVYKTADYAYVAVVDCTGHGVPGAFMSLISHTLLNEAVVERNMSDPKHILEWLSNRVGGALKQNEAEGSRDGLDMSLVVLEQQADGSAKLRYSGAKQDLYYTEHGQLITLDSDRRTVAGWQRNRMPYTTQEVIVKSGEMVYMATDGYADQHGQKEKKIGTSRFKKLLENNAYLALSAQKNLLEEKLDQHQANVQQRDDITILGFKIS